MKRQLTKNELRSTKISRQEFFNISRNPVYIVLDSLKCAHNIGTILRLSDALLVKKVFLCGETIVPPNKKIKASSRGSEKWVQWEYQKNTIDVINRLKNLGIFIVAAEISDSSIDYQEAKYHLPVCIVLGREYDGVSENVLNLSDCIVHLPIFGMVNSINVSATASVLLYDIIRRLKTNKME